MTVLVDSNIILDILTNDPNWFSWSSKQLKTADNIGTMTAIAQITQVPG